MLCRYHQKWYEKYFFEKSDIFEILAAFWHLDGLAKVPIGSSHNPKASRYMTLYKVLDYVPCTIVHNNENLVSSFCHQGSISSTFYVRGFFEAFLRTTNCNLRTATSTAKCDLQMAQPAQFLHEKAWWNVFSKTSSFFVFHVKKPRLNMLMKLMPGGLYLKHVTILNDDSRVIRLTLHIVASHVRT
jgi:hypothetical protein